MAFSLLSNGELTIYLPGDDLQPLLMVSSLSPTLVMTSTILVMTFSLLPDGELTLYALGDDLQPPNLW